MERISFFGFLFFCLRPWKKGRDSVKFGLVKNFPVVLPGLWGGETRGSVCCFFFFGIYPTFFGRKVLFFFEFLFIFIFSGESARKKGKECFPFWVSVPFPDLIFRRGNFLFLCLLPSFVSSFPS